MAPPGFFGVTPDLVCLAKALGGGLSTAAIGGSTEVMGLIENGGYEQVGTFNGNPLAMAAARAMLTEVLDDAAYARLDRLRDRMRDGLQGVVDRYDAPWRVVTVGAKGCVSFLPHPIRNFRDFRELDGRYGHAHWLVQHNRGAFLPPWGKVEQWLISVQHTDADVDRFVANTEHLAERLLRTSRLTRGSDLGADAPGHGRLLERGVGQQLRGTAPSGGRRGRARAWRRTPRAVPPRRGTAPTTRRRTRTGCSR